MSTRKSGKLVASHLVPYFALDGDQSGILENLNRLDQRQKDFSERILIDTSGKTGKPLPNTEFYDRAVEDIEKGQINPVHAEEIAESSDRIYLVGGKPNICMANLYESLNNAAKISGREPEFQILPSYTFMGPGEETLEDYLRENYRKEPEKRDSEFSQFLSDLFKSYNFRDNMDIAPLANNNSEAVQSINSYLTESQQIYRAGEILDQKGYETKFASESPRFQNYNSSDIEFELYPSGAVWGRTQTSGASNIFEDLEEFEIDYHLNISGENTELQLYSQDNYFVLKSDDEVTSQEVEEILSENNLPIKYLHKQS